VELQYKGIMVEQLRGGPRLVLFSAPAQEIELWSGIPQRRRLDGGIETAGFQREEKPKRVSEIAAFMGETQNVIQNPLLAAVQDNDLVTCSEEMDSDYCTITVRLPDFASFSLLKLIRSTLSELTSRVPGLGSRPADDETVLTVRRSMAELGINVLSSDNDESDAPDEAAEDDVVPSEEQGDVGVTLFDEESQVIDFYDELNARRVVLEELGPQADSLDSIGGFTRDFLISLVKPVVLVDGQHRLRGALQAITQFENSDAGTKRIADLIDAGKTPAEATEHLAQEFGRRLPVSLLLNDSPAEHVFQFVVVNQKATPMSSALLGTIVSTSLTHAEMDPIRDRLRKAGIELEGSRAISYMRRAVESPFRGLVSTGVIGDKPNALPWSVLAQLIHVVRYLEQGEYYHPPKIDYARLWRRDAFPKTALVEHTSEGVDQTSEERFAAWSAIDGPWRTMFIKLHTSIRDKFGDLNDPRAQNYWGSTKSNLFNMVSLKILTADFFAFIHTRTFQSWEEVDDALKEWIGDLSSEYFARDWRMGGTKKDQPAIKVNWSSTWADYRLTRERLPRVERYNPGGKGVSV
jgi:hypothetical protein